MEEVVQYLSDFTRCVQYHVGKAYRGAVHEVTHFHDVEAYVAAELQVNQTVKEKTERLSSDLEAVRQSVSADVATAQQELAAMRLQYAKTAQPMLARYDDTSLARHYYTELLNTIENQEYMVQQLQSRETGNYGYRSKRMISLGLTLDALKQKMALGKPFQRELQSLVDDAESAEVALIASPLQSVASSGLCDTAELRRASHSLARAMEATAKSSPVSAVKTWMDYLKFRSVKQPKDSQAQQMHVAMVRDAAQLFLSKVDVYDWASALEVADKNFLASITTADTAACAPYLAELQNFRQLAVPRVAADQFLMYAEASLTTARLAFVEDLLKMQ